MIVFIHASSGASSGTRQSYAGRFACGSLIPPSGKMAGVRSGVVERTFGLLDAFESERSLSLSELAARAGLPVNTTLRLARSLVGVGALERGDDGRFSLGLHLYELATLAPRGVGLRGASLPYLQHLHELTGAHAMLSVREGRQTVLIERVSAPRTARRLEYRVGGRMPLPLTAGGLVLLASAPADIQDTVVAAFDPRRAMDGLRSGADLRRSLATIRRTRTVVATRKLDQVRAAVGVPLLSPTGEAVAALSLMMDAPRRRVDSLLPALAMSARAIERDLR
ncbi:IclR family transcriptional regulator [Humibacter albus]|uniref:IclR family transcriptional regulator n=1 Tax=Humibacter albus TaxID=427754 RepID=UPI00146D7BA6|nr:IclR family transcriptional regulator [Humibacter albus]